MSILQNIILHQKVLITLGHGKMDSILKTLKGLGIFQSYFLSFLL